MRKDHRGQPSGSNKLQEPGIKPVMSSENLEGIENMREKYTKVGDQEAEDVNETHPGKNKGNENSKNTNVDRR